MGYIYIYISTYIRLKKFLKTDISTRQSYSNEEQNHQNHVWKGSSEVDSLNDKK